MTPALTSHLPQPVPRAVLAPRRVVILALAGLTPSPLGLALGHRRSQFQPVLPLMRLPAPPLRHRRVLLAVWVALALQSPFPTTPPPPAQPPRLPAQLLRPPRRPGTLVERKQPYPSHCLVKVQRAPVGRRRFPHSRFLRALARRRRVLLVGWVALAAPYLFPTTSPPPAQPPRLPPRAWGPLRALACAQPHSQQPCHPGVTLVHPHAQ